MDWWVLKLTNFMSNLNVFRPATKLIPMFHWSLHDSCSCLVWAPSQDLWQMGVLELQRLSANHGLKKKGKKVPSKCFIPYVNQEKGYLKAWSVPQAELIERLMATNKSSPAGRCRVFKGGPLNLGVVVFDPIELAVGPWLPLHLRGRLLRCLPPPHRNGGRGSCRAFGGVFEATAFPVFPEDPLLHKASRRVLQPFLF